MNKAILLSVIIYPGAGHLWLKKYRMGLSLILLTTIALSVVLYQTVQLTMEIMHSLPGEQVLQLSVMQLSEMVTQADTGIILTASYIILILWVVGIVDTFRISRQQNNELTHTQE